MDLHTFRILVGTLISLISSTLDYRGLTPLLLTQKPIYSFSVCPKNDFSTFTFNPAYVSLYGCFSNAFRWSLKSFIVITSTYYIRTHHVKPFKYFGYIILENIGTVADPHGYFLVLLIYPCQHDSKDLFGFC